VDHIAHSDWFLSFELQWFFSLFPPAPLLPAFLGQKFVAWLVHNLAFSSLSSFHLQHSQLSLLFSTVVHHWVLRFFSSGLFFLLKLCWKEAWRRFRPYFQGIFCRWHLESFWEFETVQSSWWLFHQFLQIHYFSDQHNLCWYGTDHRSCVRFFFKIYQDLILCPWICRFE